MKLIKRIFRLTPMLITWAMLGVLFWGFVFTRITDTDRAHKIVLCVDAQVPGAAELETRMTGLARGPIRLVRVLPFSYAMMDASTLTDADLLIVRDTNLERYADWFAPWPEQLSSAGRFWERDGVPCGLLIHTAGQADALSAYIDYAQPPQDGDADYYLCIGAHSLHTGGSDVKNADATGIFCAEWLAGLTGAVLK